MQWMPSPFGGFPGAASPCRASPFPPFSAWRVPTPVWALPPRCVGQPPLPANVVDPITRSSSNVPYPPQRFKTQLCRNDPEGLGLCPFATKCTYAHGAGELRRHPCAKPKTRLCELWLSRAGACPRGAACWFAHGPWELEESSGSPQPGLGPSLSPTPACDVVEERATGLAEEGEPAAATVTGPPCLPSPTSSPAPKPPGPVPVGNAARDAGWRPWSGLSFCLSAPLCTPIHSGI